jgi:hypothetical protein
LNNKDKLKANFVSLNYKNDFNTILYNSSKKRQLRVNICRKEVIGALKGAAHRNNSAVRVRCTFLLSFNSFSWQEETTKVKFLIFRINPPLIPPLNEILQSEDIYNQRGTSP